MTIQARASVQEGTIFTNTTVTVPLATGSAVGDVALVALQSFDVVTSVPSGWTLQQTSTNTDDYNLYAKVLTSADISAGSASWTLATNFLTNYISISVFDSGGGSVGIGASSKEEMGFTNTWLGNSVTAVTTGAALYAFVLAASGSDVVAADPAMTIITSANTFYVCQQQTSIPAGATGTRGGAITSGFTNSTTTFMILVEPVSSGFGISVVGYTYVTP